MSQLTYWSLQNYDHVAAVRGPSTTMPALLLLRATNHSRHTCRVRQVRTARKSLAKQMGGLMMSQWHEHRHICENYNPHKTADTSGGDCSGTKFYHWGALTGMITLVEEGFY